MTSYSYMVTYKEEEFDGFISHGIRLDTKLAPNITLGELKAVRETIEQTNNHGGRRVVEVVELTLEERMSPGNPPIQEGEYIVDLGPGREMRVEPAYFNDSTWWGKFSRKYIAPHQWLSKTPIITRG